MPEGENVKAIILAAGEGKRLRPLTYSIPKPLLPVAGKPTIEYVIDNIITAPVRDIYIATRASDRSDSIKRYFENSPREDIKIHTIDVLGWETGGDLKAVSYEAGIKEDDAFIVAFGDNITEINLECMLKEHKRRKKLVTMAVFPVPEEDKKRFGIAVLNDEKEIIEFIEKPQHPEKIKSNLANAGYYVFEGNVLGRIPYGRVRTEDSIIPQLVKENQVTGFEITPPYWLDIGTVESYNLANKMILEKKGILPPPNFKK